MLPGKLRRRKEIHLYVFEWLKFYHIKQNLAYKVGEDFYEDEKISLTFTCRRWSTPCSICLASGISCPDLSLVGRAAERRHRTEQRTAREWLDCPVQNLGTRCDWKDMIWKNVKKTKRKKKKQYFTQRKEVPHIASGRYDFRLSRLSLWWLKSFI